MGANRIMGLIDPILRGGGGTIIDSIFKISLAIRGIFSLKTSFDPRRSLRCPKYNFATMGEYGYVGYLI